MTTVRDLIKSSMRPIGVVASGENPSPAELMDGLEALNMMLNSLSAQAILIYAVTKESFNLVAGQGSYTIGPEGNFNTVRPKMIKGAFIRDVNGLDYPVRIRGMEEYRLISSKSTPGRPYRLFYNPSSPLGTIYTYPVPNDIEALHMDSLKPLTGTVELDDDLSLPLEYEEFLKYNLCVRIAPEYGKSVPAEVAVIAEDSRYTIVSLNAENNQEPVETDFPAVMKGNGYYDITEG